MATLLKITNKIKSLGLAQFLSLLFLIIIFIHILYQNLQYTSSFSVIPLRELDEFPFQKILMSMAGEIKRGEFSYFFNNYQFGYGNSWWLLNTIFILPFKNFPSLHIFIPRFITQVFGFLSLVLIYKRVHRFNFNGLLILLLIGTSFLFFRISTFFHNHSLLFFLSTLLFYLVSTRKPNKFIIFFIAGFGSGIKLTFLPITFFFATYMFFLLYKNKDLSIPKDITLPFLSLYGYFIGLSPLNAFLYNIPQILKLFKEALINSSSLGIYQAQSLSLYDYFKAIDQFSTTLFNTNLWPSLFFINIILMGSFKFFVKDDKLKLLAPIALLVYLPVMYYLLYNGYSLWDVAMYLSSMVGVLLLSIYTLLKSVPKQTEKVFLFIFSLLLLNNIYCLYSLDQHRFSYYTHQARMENDQKKINFLSKAKPLLKNYEIKTIFYGFGIPHFFGGYSKIFYEDTLYGVDQILQSKNCTLYIYPKDRVPQSDQLTAVYEDNIGGFGIFNCN